MFGKTIVAALLAVLALPVAGSAANLTVTDADTVKPDAELIAFLSELRTLAAPAKKSSIRKVETFFAPHVKTFQRSLDPFQPWNPTDDLTGKYLDGVAGVMVEQGELEAGVPVPDYRINAMQQIAELISEGGTFGTLKEMPGAICAPAAYRVDRKAALRFAGKFELDAYSLRFFDTEVALKPQPGSASAGVYVPPRTLLMFDYKPGLDDGWGYYETSDGSNGYMADRDDTRGLSQNHLCFSKVKGKYKISAVFGYGL